MQECIPATTRVQVDSITCCTPVFVLTQFYVPWDRVLQLRGFNSRITTITKTKADDAPKIYNNLQRQNTKTLKIPKIYGKKRLSLQLILRRRQILTRNRNSVPLDLKIERE